MRRLSSQVSESNIFSKKPKTESTSINRADSPIRGNDEKFKLDTFFQGVINIKPRNNENKIAFLLVNHVVPTLPPFLTAIEKMGRIALIVPKGSHKDQSTLELISERYGKSLINNFTNNTSIDSRTIVEQEAVAIIKKATNVDEKILIIDIGGYFSTNLEAIVEEFKDRFLGVVEDTENGHQKYLEVVGKALCPILSVARSELKKTEDYNVGKSIVEATGTLLRINAHTMLERMQTVGVIGFGKIGRSISEHLQQKNIRKIIVYDNDSIRLMEASSLGFKVVKRDKLLEKSDTIFCATGRKSLVGLDFFDLKDNVFIASCTSADDEFDLSLLHSSARLAEKQPSLEGEQYIDKFYLGDKRTNLIYGGNAVNFIHGAVNGPYIYSVQAGLILAAINIINSDIQPNFKEIQELSREDMSNIANVWLISFEGYSHASNFHIDNKEFVEQLSIPDTSTLTKALIYSSFASDLYNNFAERDKIKPLIELLYRSIITLDTNHALTQQLRYFSSFYNGTLTQHQPFAQDADKLQCYNEGIQDMLDIEFLPFAEHLCKECLNSLPNITDENVKATILYNCMRVYFKLGDNITALQYHESLKNCNCDDDFKRRAQELVESMQSTGEQAATTSSSMQFNL